MPGYEDLSRTLPAIETTLHYIDPQAPIGGINDVEREKSTFRLLPYQTAIRDMRPIAKSLSLDRTGFVLVERLSRVTDFYDPKQVEEIYYPEIEAMIRELTGADRVLIFGTLLRNNSPDAPTVAHKSVHNAHIDYDLRTVRGGGPAAARKRPRPLCQRPDHADQYLAADRSGGELSAGAVRFIQHREGRPGLWADRRQEPGRGAGPGGLQCRLQCQSSLVLRPRHAAGRGVRIPAVRFRHGRAAMGGAHVVHRPDQRPRRRAAPKHRTAHTGAIRGLIRASFPQGRRRK